MDFISGVKKSEGNFVTGNKISEKNGTKSPKIILVFDSWGVKKSSTFTEVGNMGYISSGYKSSGDKIQQRVCIYRGLY